jgi:hypothetical protein
MMSMGQDFRIGAPRKKFWATKRWSARTIAHFPLRYTYRSSEKPPSCQYEGEEPFQRGTPAWLFQDVSALSGIQASAQTDGPFDSGPYVPLIMVIALRPKMLKTIDVRIRLMSK